MIDIRGISKIYGKNKVAVNNINCRIDSGISTIIGKNGAGKTTLLRILSTQLKPSSGDAFIDNLSIIRDVEKVRKKIVSIPQESSPIGILTSYEQVFMYLTARGFSFKSAKDEALNALKIVNLYDDRNKPTDELSGGMKRKMFVAMALASNAENIFLDEPTTGLDPISRMETWSAIKMLNGNVILTTHYMEEARELSQKIYMINDGSIINSGTYDKLLYPYRNKIRVESYSKLDNSYNIGNIYIKYINSDEIGKYNSEYNVIKRITIEDLFIMRGVDIEY